MVGQGAWSEKGEVEAGCKIFSAVSISRQGTQVPMAHNAGAMQQWDDGKEQPTCLLLIHC